MHRLVAARTVVSDTVDAEIEIRPVELLGLAAYQFAFGFEVTRQAVHETQFCARQAGIQCGVFMRESRIVQPSFGDDMVEFVVPQIGDDRHLL